MRRFFWGALVGLILVGLLMLLLAFVFPVQQSQEAALLAQSATA